MNESQRQPELVAVKLDDGWFMSLRNGDPSQGLMISEDAARLIIAAEPLLMACRIAHAVLKRGESTGGGEDQKTRLLAESALVHLEEAIKLADGA